MKATLPAQAPSMGKSNTSLSSFSTLGLVILLILSSLAQTFYRLTLPSDGWSYARDTTGAAQRLVFEENISKMPSALREGDVLVAIEGQPISEILAAALASRARPPEYWVERQSVAYTVERAGRQVTVQVLLQRLSVARILGRYGNSQLMNPAPLLTLLIALFVFLKLPNNTSARLLLLLSGAVFSSDGISQAVTGTNVIGPAEMFHPGAYWPSQFFNSLIWPLLIAPFFLHLLLSFQVFKTPLKNHPRLRMLLLYGYMPILTSLAAAISIGRPLTFWRIWSTLSLIDFFAVLLAAIAAIAYTLVTNRHTAESARVRWLAWGTMIASLGTLLGNLLISMGMTGGGLLIGWLATRLLQLGLPISVAIAILRHRLFDIDIIIRRTLVYSILTATLGLMYFASVVFLQDVVRLFTGRSSSELVTVLSTLGIAALFIPVRRGVQNFIDRRFYRGKYNAERALEAFNESLRYQVDLEQISERIVTVADSTLQPEHVSLWLVRPKN